MSDSSDDQTNTSHNSETNTAASNANLCGMTHLASGQVCLLPRGHSGGCEFHRESDMQEAIKRREPNT
jgi:hypothetical protein